MEGYISNIYNSFSNMYRTSRFLSFFICMWKCINCCMRFNSMKNPLFWFCKCSLYSSLNFSFICIRALHVMCKCNHSMETPHPELYVLLIFLRRIDMWFFSLKRESKHEYYVFINPFWLTCSSLKIPSHIELQLQQYSTYMVAQYIPTYNNKNQ